LNSLKSSGLVDQDTYNRGLEKEAQTMTTALRSIEDNSKKVTSEWQELGPVFSSAFEDAIVEGENLRGVLKGLEQDIIRIVTRNLVTKPLGDAIGGLFSSGSSGNPLSNILSAISGSLAGIFRASGGPVYAGSPYIVGERGPELFVPRQSGGIIPNNQMAAAGGVTINMTVTTPDANSFRMSEGQIGQRAAMLVRRSQRNF
jgi:phage-related minor tail protein